MPKLQVIIPEEMRVALQQAANIEDRIAAAIVRQAIAKYLLETHNIKVDAAMEWGGARRSGEDEE